MRMKKSTTTPVPKKALHVQLEEKDKELYLVQTVVKVAESMMERVGLKGWRFDSGGRPFSISTNSDTFQDPSYLFSWRFWPLRSTLVRQGENNAWFIVEFCSRYMELENRTGQIAECDGSCDVLTVLHNSNEGEDVLGEIIGEERTRSDGNTVEQTTSGQTDFQFAFRGEPSVPQELQDGLTQEEMEQPDTGRGNEEENLKVAVEDRDVLMINGHEVYPNSPIKLLWNAAEYLGLSGGGSKAQVWKRLNEKIQLQEAIEAFEVANKLYLEEARPQGLHSLPLPRQPTEEEVQLHQLTHLPFRPWCPHCVACKSKEDKQRLLDEEPRRRIPSLEVDYCYVKEQSREQGTTVMVVLDTGTKNLLAIPIPSKARTLKYQAEQIVRFSLYLNYYDLMELVSDNEPVLKSVMEAVRTIRQSLGFATTLTFAKPYSKGRTGQVERAIQTLRRQASTVMHQLEEHCQMNYGVQHPLVSWAYIHAAWLLNRFHCHSTVKCSPFELVNGRRYSGRLVGFGEKVLVLNKSGHKHGPQWFPGIWLGKTTDGSDDLHAVSTPSGLVKSRAIRRTAKPWDSIYTWMVKDLPYKLADVQKRAPRIVPGFAAEPKPVEKSKDKDAEDVERYALDNGDSEEEPNLMGTAQTGQLGGESQQTSTLMQEEEPHFGEAGLQIPTTPTLPSASAEDATIEDDTEAKEPKQKAARTSPSSSPTAQMFPPHFAGSINQVVNDYQWEQDLYDDLDGEEMALEDFENEDMEEPMDKGQPPELSAEELEKVEAEAGITEITRLLAMGVMENPTPEEEEHGKLLSTRSVFDWRFRDGQWRRRCRYVAREFKAGDKGNYGHLHPLATMQQQGSWFFCIV